MWRRTILRKAWLSLLKIDRLTAQQTEMLECEYSRVTHTPEYSRCSSVSTLEYPIPESTLEKPPSE